MAEIEILPDAANLRGELEQLDEAGLIGNIIMANAGLHAMRHLLRVGATPANAQRMAEQLEDNLAVVEQVAAAKGISLEIIHRFRK